MSKEKKPNKRNVSAANLLIYYVSKKYIHYSNAQNIIQTKRD
jgi:hypothetical protein